MSLYFAKGSRHVLKQISRFGRDEKGVTLVEYGILLVFITLVCTAALQLLGTQINGFFTFIVRALAPAV
jgi:pilus assembly protein Flp/PilA